MNHVALDRPGAHDRHLDHQVVEVLRLEPRQHGHLRPRLDLEYADGVGAADHVVGRRAVGRDACQGQLAAAMAIQQVETTAQGAEHAQGKDIDLEQADQVEVVLVPLDHRALVHGGVFHRHQAVQRLFGNHEATRVLGQVAGKTDQLAGQRQHPAQPRAVGVETGFAQLLGWWQAVAPAPAAISQGVDLLHRQTQHPGDIAHRTGGVIGAGHCGECRAVTAIAAEHVLQHLFAAIVFEVDVDVRRLVALAGQKALEQQVAFHRVELGDAQHEAHHRVGRRATPLTENALAPGKVDDVVNGKEVAFVVELGNQFQLMLQGLASLVADTFGPTPALALLAQMTQPGAGRLAFRHQFAGVLIAQLAKVETATRGNAQAFLKQCRRIQLGQLRQRAQVPLAIGEQALPGLGNAAVMADGSHAVLQGAAAAGMHVHIAAGHRGDAEAVGQGQQLLQAPRVIRATVQLDRQP
ncbi:hypothetical protein D3C81_798970 [compost metagenome]